MCVYVYVYIWYMVCVCVVCICAGAHGGQTMSSEPLELELDSCKLLCGYWESNLGPLEEGLLLSPEPSLQPSEFV